MNKLKLFIKKLKSVLFGAFASSFLLCSVGLMLGLLAAPLQAFFCDGFYYGRKSAAIEMYKSDWIPIGLARVVEPNEDIVLARE